MKRSGFTALLIIAAGASIAGAAPGHVDASRCPGIEQAALDVAVGRELALDPKLATMAEHLGIVISCSDDLHARLRVEPDPIDGPLAKDLDLQEEPPALRIKLIALTVAELVDDVVVSAASTRAASTVPPAADREDVPEVARAAPAANRGPQITVRAGVRIFADDQAPMPSLSMELATGPIGLGIAMAIGDNHRFAGVPYIVALTVSRSLVCAHGTTSLCIVARGELGFAGVSIAGEESMMEHSVHSGYGDLTLGFEIEHPFGGYAALAGIEIGAADGLVVEARYLEHLDGPFAVAGIGMKW